MRSNRYLLGCLAVILIGCGTPELTPATIDTTTTTSAPATTTSAPTTTSISAATTTTTTVPVAEGDALVVSESSVLGWWADGAWQQDAEYRPLEAGSEFQIFSVGDEPFLATGAESVLACEWAGDSMRQIPLDLPQTSQFGRIGVSAPWTVDSGEAHHVEADQFVVDVAIELLADVGIDELNPDFAQVIETDLDGDGAAETLAVLDHEAGAFDVEEGAYGIAFIVHEDSDVQVVGEYDVYADDPEAAVHIVAQYRFLAVMDVNNDGTDEVTMSWSSFESGGETLFALDTETSQLTQALGQGCGV